MMRLGTLPEWDVAAWINTRSSPSLRDFRGKVLVIHAFQMLCPGCVAHGIPQAKAIHQTFPHGRVQVVGLHTVFEHHDAMTDVALKAFLHEYGVHFPVGMDRRDPRGDPIPMTMKAWGLQGTPTLIVLDQEGRVCLNHFGRMDDLRVGAVLGQIMGDGH